MTNKWFNLLEELYGQKSSYNQLIWLLIPGNADLLKKTGMAKDGFGPKSWDLFLKTLHLKETVTLSPLPFDNKNDRR